jgi:hypothetical protein
MQFGNPLFLYGLLALSIPIVIHLFHFRRVKKIFFSDISLLKEIKQEQKNLSRLKNLLILLSRILAFLFLILAFARPFIPAKDTQLAASSYTALYIDNSQSMQALSSSSDLLTEAKSKAKEIVRSSDAQASFQILDNSLSRNHQFLMDQEEALMAIDEIEIGYATSPFSSITEAFNELREREKLGPATLFVLSDLQKSTFDLENLKDSINVYNILPIQSAARENVAIDSAWFEAPRVLKNQVNALILQTTNYGINPVDNIQITLKQEDRIRPAGSLSLLAGETRRDTLPLTVMQGGLQSVELRITDYPVVFDDGYFISFEVKENLEILVLGKGERNLYFERAFANTPHVNLSYTQFEKVVYSSLEDYDLLVLEDLTEISSGLASLLGSFVKEGGSLLVFPGWEEGQKNILSNLTQELNLPTFKRGIPSSSEAYKINTQEFIFSEVFKKIDEKIRLPLVQAYYPIALPSHVNAEKLIEMRNDLPYLVKFNIAQGQVFLCAAPAQVEYNNLVLLGDIFIPMLYKMALSSRSDLKYSYLLGKSEPIRLRFKREERQIPGDEVFSLKGPNDLIPRQQNINNYLMLYVEQGVTEPGIYNLFRGEVGPLAKLAFNFDRKESDLAAWNPGDLRSIKTNASLNILSEENQLNLASFVQSLESGKQLWKWCLLLALLFILAEVLLIRVLK